MAHQSAPGNVPGNPKRNAELVDEDRIDPFNKAFAIACEREVISDELIDAFCDRIDHGGLSFRHLYRLFQVPRDNSPWSDLKRLAWEYLSQDSRFKNFLDHIRQRDGQKKKWRSRATFRSSSEKDIWYSCVAVNLDGQSLSTPYMASGKDQQTAEYHAALDFLEYYFSDHLVPADTTKKPPLHDVQTTLREEISDVVQDPETEKK